MDLSNKEIRLLNRARHKESVPAKPQDYDYLFRLGDKKLIINNLDYSDKLGFFPKSYSLTAKGKYQLELLNTNKKHEKAIHIWYPTIVNVTYGIVGFFIGWLLKSLFH